MSGQSAPRTIERTTTGDGSVARFCFPAVASIALLVVLVLLLQLAALLAAAPLGAQSSEPVGVRRDHHTRDNVIVLLASGVVTFGVLWVLPEDMSKWPKEDRRLNHFLDAYRSPPVWDRDPFFWNYIAHPLIGQWCYLMERNHGESRLRSFLFSTAASVGWEYGFEAAIEHPSAQDLLTTSPIGSVLGELSYVATQRMGRNGFNRWEKAAMVVVNPVYVVQKGYRPTAVPSVTR